MLARSLSTLLAAALLVPLGCGSESERGSPATTNAGAGGDSGGATAGGTGGGSEDTGGSGGTADTGGSAGSEDTGGSGGSGGAAETGGAAGSSGSAGSGGVDSGGSAGNGGTAGSAGTAGDGGSAGSLPDFAVVRVSNGTANTSQYTYPDTAVGDTAEHAFTLTNHGGITATDIVADPDLGSVFSYTGGSYPGTGGDCGSTLAAGASCTVVVTFAPTSAMSVSGMISFTFESGFGTFYLNHAILGPGV